MKNRLIVVCVIKKEDQVLLARKPENQGPYPNKWHIPGGGVHLNEENCEEAIIREVKEETGLEIKDLQKIGWDTDIEPDKNNESTYYIFLEYIADYDSGVLCPQSDIVKLEWVDIIALNDYDLNRAAKATFKRIGFLN